MFLPAILSSAFDSRSPEFCMIYSAYTEKEMATHFSTLAWKMPWTEEPGRLQSMGLQRVEHDQATLLSLFTFMSWRRKWQPVREYLMGGFLRAVSHESFVPLQAEQHPAPRD